MCQAKTIQEVLTSDTENPDPETLYLGEVKNDPNFWKVNLNVNGHSTLFKIDTSAAFSVLSDKPPWIREVQLEPSDRVLHGPGDMLLNVRGMINSNLQYQNKHCHEQIYILENQSMSLLSRNACVALDLIKVKDFIHEVQPNTDQQANFKAEFPNLFTALGKLKTKYKITLDKDVQPLCSRHVKFHIH